MPSSPHAALLVGGTSWPLTGLQCGHWLEALKPTGMASGEAQVAERPGWTPAQKRPETDGDMAGILDVGWVRSKPRCLCENQHDGQPCALRVCSCEWDVHAHELEAVPRLPWAPRSGTGISAPFECLTSTCPCYQKPDQVMVWTEALSCCHRYNPQCQVRLCTCWEDSREVS